MRVNLTRLRLAVFALGACLAVMLVFAPAAQAHRPGESYVYLKVSDGPLLGEFHVRFSDLAKALALDGDGDGAISEAEVLARQPDIADYLAARLRFYDAAGRHVPVPGALDFFGPDNARQIQLHFSVPSLDPPPDLIEAEYRFLYDEVDPAHRPMLLFKSNTRMRLDENEWVVSLVFETGAERQVVNMLPPPAAALIPEFIRYGVFQILFSPLHLALVLIGLLACLRWRRGEEVPELEPPRRVALDAGLVALAIAGGFVLGLLLRDLVHYRLSDGRNAGMLVAALLMVSIDNAARFRSAWRYALVVFAGGLCGAARSDFGLVAGLNKGLVEIVIPSFALGIAVAISLLAVAVLPGAYLLLRRVPAGQAVIRSGFAIFAVGAVIYLFFRLVL